MSLAERIYILLAGDNIHLKNIEPDVDEWETFLNHLPEVHDAIDRAHNKYLCRQYFFSRKKITLFDAVGLGCMILEMPLLLFSNKGRNTDISDCIILEKHNEVGYEDVAPLKELAEHGKIKVIENINKRFGVVSRESRKAVLACIRRYPRDFFFHYFVLKELLAHDRIIKNHAPRATAVYVNERNVASPILREAYENQGRKFISFMHGEYLLNLIQGYMSFSEYYIWDESYIDTFQNFLKCDIGEYHVYTPKKLEKKWKLEAILPEYDYTYYFSNEKSEQIAMIASLLSALQQRGKRCKVRPHPRFIQDVMNSANLFEGILIEDPKKVTMEDSLGKTEYAVGLRTTVLYEAEVEGRGIVLDDVTDKEAFDNMKNRRSRLIYHPHLLLSESLKDNNIDI